MSEYYTVLKTELKEKFQIEPTNVFNTISNESITLLKNQSNIVNYHNVQSKGGSTTDLKFELITGDKNFIHNNFLLSKKIPLKVVLTADHAVDIDANNYIDVLKDNIAFRQYPLLSVINGVTLKLNNNSVTTLNENGIVFKIVSQYYQDSLINEHLEASQVDRFQKYSHYDAAAQTINTLSEDGVQIKMSIPPMSEQNIFSNNYNAMFNSRVPVFEFDSTSQVLAVNKKKEICLFVRVNTILPFSLFGLSDSDDSIYGVKNLTLDISLVDNFVAKMFSCKSTINNIHYNTQVTEPADFNVLTIKEITPPQYITNTMVDNATGFIKPYRKGFSSFKKFTDSTVVIGNGSKNQQVHLRQINFTNMPKSMYIAFKRKLDPTQPFRTTDSYARIRELSISVNNQVTNIRVGANGLYNIAKGNGLNLDKLTALYLSSYALKLDMKKDLGIGSDSLIGQIVNGIINIEAVIEKLDDVTEIVEYEPIVVLINESQMWFDNGEFNTKEGLIVNSNQLSTSIHHADLYSAYMPQISMIGGAPWYKNLFNTVKKGVNTAVNFAKENPELMAKAVKLMAAGDSNIIGGTSNIIGGTSNIIGGSNNPLNGAGNIRSVKFK